MMEVFGPLRHLDFWTLAALDSDGGGGGGSSSDSKSDSKSSSSSASSANAGRFDAVRSELEDAGYTVNDAGTAVYNDHGQVAGQGWSGSSTVSDIANNAGRDDRDDRSSGSTTTTSQPQTFDEAFAKARAEQGAGGTFEYNGNLYTTDYAPSAPASAPVVSYDAFGNPYTSSEAAAAADIAAEKAATAANQQSGFDYSTPYSPPSTDYYDAFGDVYDSSDSAAAADAAAEQAATEANQQSGFDYSTPYSPPSTDYYDAFGDVYDSSDSAAAADIAAEQAATEANQQGDFDYSAPYTPDTSAPIIDDMASLGEITGEFADVPDYAAGTSPAETSPWQQLYNAGSGQALDFLGSAAEALGATEWLGGTSQWSPVGYGEGKVDPSLASKLQGTTAGATQVPSNMSNPVIDWGRGQREFAQENLIDPSLERLKELSPDLYDARLRDIWSWDEGDLLPSVDMQALGAQTMEALPGSIAGAVGLPAGIPGLMVTGGVMTGGEVASQSYDQAYAEAKNAGYSDSEARAYASDAQKAGMALGVPLGALSGAINPFSSGIASNIGEEAFSEGFLEQMAQQAAVNQAFGRGPFEGGLQFNPNEATVAALLSGGPAAANAVASSGSAGAAAADTGLGASVPAGPAAPYGGMDTSGIMPGLSQPSFVSRPGEAASMIIDAEQAPAGAGFSPSGPTVGQIAQTPQGILDAYKQAADTMAEAGVSGVGDVEAGRTPSTSMDVMAAVDIINNEVAETGGLSMETAKRLEEVTGLSAQDIDLIARDAIDLGQGPAFQDPLLQDEVTGVGGGSRIGMTTNEDGTTTLTNLDTGHTATVEVGENVDQAVKIFDEVTTPVKDTTTATEAGVVGTPSTDLTIRPSTDITRVSDTTETGVVGTPSTDLTTITGTDVAVTDTAGTDVGPVGTTDVALGTGTDVTTDLGTGTEVSTDVYTPAEDYIEGELADEIAGEITDQTDAKTDTTTDTTTDTNIFVETPLDPDELQPDDTVDVPVDDVAGGDGDTTVELAPEIADESEPQEVAPFECPEGYEAVKLAGRWTCQRTTSYTVGRPTQATSPYLSRRGFAGTNPRQPIRTTRTVTETVKP